jgi:predicted transposase YdaD
MTAAEEWMKLGEARGRAAGRSEGRTEEARRILRNLLQLKFGAVPQSLSSRIDAATHDALEQAVGRILAATSPDSVL